MMLRDTQKQFYALDLHEERYHTSTDDAVNLARLKISAAKDDKTLKHVASVYDYQSDVVRDGIQYEGKRIITFAGILQHETFPLAAIVKELLEIGQQEMNLPIEIEFAVNMDVPEGLPYVFNFLQIRPIVETDQSASRSIWIMVNPEETILYSQSALGNGEFTGIRDLVYVKPESWDPAKSSEIASLMEASTVVSTRRKGQPKKRGEREMDMCWLAREVGLFRSVAGDPGEVVADLRGAYHCGIGTGELPHRSQPGNPFLPEPDLLRGGLHDHQSLHQ